MLHAVLGYVRVCIDAWLTLHCCSCKNIQHRFVGLATCCSGTQGAVAKLVSLLWCRGKYMDFDTVYLFCRMLPLLPSTDQ